uniref:hypothetical protein n=1 Tax=Prevotella heparinolytica TaxID=28113 RepID=UPI00359F6AFA
IRRHYGLFIFDRHLSLLYYTAVLADAPSPQSSAFTDLPTHSNLWNSLQFFMLKALFALRGCLFARCEHLSAGCVFVFAPCEQRFIQVANKFTVYSKQFYSIDLRGLFHKYNTSIHDCYPLKLLDCGVTVSPHIFSTEIVSRLVFVDILSFQA